MFNLAGIDDHRYRRYLSNRKEIKPADIGFSKSMFKYEGFHKEGDKLQAFYCDFKNTLLKFELNEAAQCLENQNLLLYLFHLYSRHDKAGDLIDLSLLDSYGQLIYHIGNRLSHLIPENGRQFHSGYGFSGFLEIIAGIALHQYESPSTIEPNYHDGEFLAAFLASREVPKHTLIYLTRCDLEPWIVDYQCERSGALIFILRALFSDSKAMIVCRGTAPLPTASGAAASLFNNMLPQMGMLGVQNSWPGIESYLKTQEIKSVEIVGKSLGGGIAQMLSVLIHGTTKTKVSYLWTLQSIGTENQVHEHYKTLESHFPIDRYVTAKINGHADDLTPGVGGRHLGEWGSCERFRTLDVGLADGGISPVKLDGRWFCVIQLLRGFSSSHLLLLSRKSFNVIERKECKAVLTSPTYIEKIRRQTLCPIALVIIKIFRKQLTHMCFSDFFNSIKAKGSSFLTFPNAS